MTYFIILPTYFVEKIFFKLYKGFIIPAMYNNIQPALEWHLTHGRWVFSQRQLYFFETEYHRMLRL